MYPTYDVLNDFVSFDDWLVNYITENPGIKISFYRLKFENSNASIVVKLRHIGGFEMDRILDFDAYDKVSKKRKLIEAIEDMTYQLKQGVKKYYREVD